MKVGGTLAVFVADILHVRGARRSFFPLGLQLAALAEDAGFFPIEHIAVVRRGKALEEGPGRRHAEQAGFLLRGFSHVLVFAKPDPEFADFEPDEA